MGVLRVMHLYIIYVVTLTMYHMKMGISVFFFRISDANWYFLDNVCMHQSSFTIFILLSNFREKHVQQ